MIDIFTELHQFGLEVEEIYNPQADATEVKNEYQIDLISRIDKQYGAIVPEVSHQEFLSLNFSVLRRDEKSIIFDTKAFLDKNIIDGRL